MRLVAPEAARFARLAVSMEMGHWDRNVMQFTGLSLAPIESAGEPGWRST